MLNINWVEALGVLILLAVIAAAVRRSSRQRMLSRSEKNLHPSRTPTGSGEDGDDWAGNVIERARNPRPRNRR